MSSIIALLTAAAAKAIEAVGKTKEVSPPRFEKFDGYDPNKLDARPLIWSLENKPEEWSYPGPRPDNHALAFYLRHEPSNHLFNISWHENLCGLAAAECSCHATSHQFQTGQALELYAAAVAWDKEMIRRQFAEHFTG